MFTVNSITYRIYTSCFTLNVNCLDIFISCLISIGPDALSIGFELSTFFLTSCRYRKAGVLYRTPGDTYTENEIAEIELDDNNTDTHVFVTCLTDTPDKLYFHGRLRENQQPFSDIYEFRVYATKNVSCCIKLKITDAPASNEELSMVCFEGKCYQNEGVPVISETDQDKV